MVVHAREEARGLGHHYIGTEHLLLGLLAEPEGVGARALAALGITPDAARLQIVEIVPRGDDPGDVPIPFTPSAKRALELSLRESLNLGHDYIGSEHVLLGLARVDDGVAALVLLHFGADAEKIRGEVMPLLPGPESRRRRSGLHPEFRPAGARVQDLHLVRGLLNTAVDVASDDGRSEINSTDVLLALTRDNQTAPVLASLGVDEAAVREAIGRDAGAEDPATGSAS